MKRKLYEIWENIFAFFVYLVFHIGVWVIALTLLAVFLVGFPYFLITNKRREDKEKRDKEEADRKFEAWKKLPRE